MLRVKVPQGILTVGELKAVADVAERYSRGFAHVTTRQNFQFHFVEASAVESALRDLAEAGMTTREACGNSVRNITGPVTAGIGADEAFDVSPYAEALTRYLLRHPLSASLPRKFKMAFANGGEDHAFAAVNDIGWHARTRVVNGTTERGFLVTLAGGTATVCHAGIAYSEFLPAEDMLPFAEAVVRIFHKKGDRERRHKARMKFLVKSMGWDAFRAELEAEFAAAKKERSLPLPFDANLGPGDSFEAPAGQTLPTWTEVEALLTASSVRGPGIVPRTLAVAPSQSHEQSWRRTNVRAQKQAGFFMVTVALPLGDVSSGQMRALARIAETLGGFALSTTHDQNLLLRWVPDALLPALFQLLARAGLARVNPATIADVVSCPGAETCQLAVTHSRGVADLVSKHFETRPELIERARGATIRVSGCPNGCGLHHVATIGLQGGLTKLGERPVPQYFLYLGGMVRDGEAKFGKVAAKIPARRVPEAIERLVKRCEAEGAPGETLEAFLGRTDLKTVKSWLADLERVADDNTGPDDFIDLGDESIPIDSTMVS